MGYWVISNRGLPAFSKRIDVSLLYSREPCNELILKTSKWKKKPRKTRVQEFDILNFEMSFDPFDPTILLDFMVEKFFVYSVICLNFTLLDRGFFCACLSVDFAHHTTFL